MCTKNESTSERIIRALVALALLYAGTTLLSGTIKTVALVFAGIFLVTSLTGFCPMYTLFKKDTCCGHSCKHDHSKK